MSTVMLYIYSTHVECDTQILALVNSFTTNLRDLLSSSRSGTMLDYHVCYSYLAILLINNYL